MRHQRERSIQFGCHSSIDDTSCVLCQTSAAAFLVSDLWESLIQWA